MPLIVMVLLLSLTMCKILPYSSVDGNRFANRSKDLYNDRDQLGSKYPGELIFVARKGG